MSENQVVNLIPSLRQAGLFPSSAPLIPEDFTPTTELQVAFGEKSVSLGNLFRVSDFNVQKRDLESPEKYTLLLIDPDAPTPDDPKFAYWRHWVVSGLQPSGAPETVQTLTEYLGPGPKDE
ncbi:unnamed protein product [Aspergillus oryzae]|uniref:Unnamed protein product n=1 Tax=Aspergillus oryzae TaxID=5062 RepID=A0AAN4YSY8_ASPOZ|nr:unnamed protein product [Aspergillus oryzae]